MPRTTFRRGEERGRRIPESSTDDRRAWLHSEWRSLLGSLVETLLFCKLKYLGFEIYLYYFMESFKELNGFGCKCVSNS